MKKSLIALVLLLSLSRFCSAEDLIIRISNEHLIFTGVNFYIDEIINSKPVKGDIGTARTGIFNVKSKVKVDGGFMSSLKDCLDTSFPPADNKYPLLLNILEFTVSEKSGYSMETAEARACFEYYLKKDDKYVSVFRSDITVEKKGSVDSTKFHEENVREVLKKSFELFISSGIDLAGAGGNYVTKEDIKTASQNKDLTVREDPAAYPGEAPETAKQTEPVQDKGSVIAEAANDPVQESAESVQIEKPDETVKENMSGPGDWERTHSLGFLSDRTRGGTFLEYRYEKCTGDYENRRNSYGLGIGFYQSTDASLNVLYEDGSTEYGRISVNALPLSFFFYRKVKEGSWKGKWGIGITGYMYSGSIKMSGFGSFYNGTGTAFNLVIPFEEIIVIHNRKKSVLVSLNLDYQFPLTKARFTCWDGSYIDAPGMAGIFAGISVGFNK